MILNGFFAFFILLDSSLILFIEETSLLEYYNYIITLFSLIPLLFGLSYSLWRYQLFFTNY